MRTLLCNGTIINADGRHQADVLVADGRILAIGTGLQAAADRVIDVTRRWLLPGGVDVHTHLDAPMGDIRTADDFASGTVAAVCGGTTTVVDYATQDRGGSLHDALDAWMRLAAGRAVIDFGFHMCISDLRADVEAEIEGMVAAGVPSFKLFMAYPGRLMLNDGEIFRVLRRTAACGGLVCLHAENGSVIDVLVREALAAGHTAPRFHALTRPTALEAEAVHRGIVLAGLAGAPLYLVHLSSGDAAEEVSAARRRGARVLAETCPQYLLLSADDEQGEGGDFAGARTVMSPPLRGRAEQDALWAGLSRGDIQVVATDHCPFTREQKARGRNDFSRIPNGAPGIEHRMVLVFDAGVRTGRLSVERFVEVTATAPARIFGLYPRKGVLAEGSDADLVVFDPSGTTTVSSATHHMRVDYNLYEGRALSGAVDMVMARGEIMAESGRFVGPVGGGRFLKRAPVSPEAFVRP
jgi:dihydropyrimidinase